MSDPPSETMNLLLRWHSGDRSAIDQLIARDLPWIQQQVRKRLGPALRMRGDTEDYMQDAMIEALKYCPRFVSRSQSRFRNIMARIIENVLRDKNRWHQARRRAMSKERRIPSDSVLDLDPPNESVTRPSEGAQQNERELWVRLALEFLRPDDRKVILMRQWESKSFAEIAEELGITAETARMRFHRSLPRLGRKIMELRANRTAASD
ncbi:MAG: sigma-70 family RNA polymerase sigma factor [Planctomycetota bacterium]|nr:sigma-70 family RNA polymerase sigma factor [Planctomycetota bacterium]